MWGIVIYVRDFWKEQTVEVTLTSNPPYFDSSFSAITFETLLGMDLLTSK